MTPPLYAVGGESNSPTRIAAGYRLEATPTQSGAHHLTACSVPAEPSHRSRRFHLIFGWSIAIYREAARKVPYPEKLDLRLALRSTASTGGLDRRDDLVKAGKAIENGDGYPHWFDARAWDLLPLVLAGPPRSDGPTVNGEDYALPSSWLSEADLTRVMIAQGSRDEMLQVDAGDRS